MDISTQTSYSITNQQDKIPQQEFFLNSQTFYLKHTPTKEFHISTPRPTQCLPLFILISLMLS